MGKEWNEENIWNQPMRDPTDAEKKRMVALAVPEKVRYLMSNHLFKFREDIHKQTDGGSIGNELTGVVAKTRVIRFMRRLKQALEDSNVDAKIMKAFVDELFCAVKTIENVTDDGTSNDLNTARTVLHIANQIESDIQLTFDCPSLNSDLRMPVLDMKIWVNSHYKILHIFYEKGMANNRTI